MLKIDVASMIGRHFEQLIDHSFGRRFPTLAVRLNPTPVAWDINVLYAVQSVLTKGLPKVSEITIH